MVRARAAGCSVECCCSVSRCLRSSNRHLLPPARCQTALIQPAPPCSQPSQASLSCTFLLNRVDVPIDPPTRPLPSDVYNPVMTAGHHSSTLPARGYGLGGLGLGGQGGSQAPPATPPPALEPYGGVHARPIVPSPEQLSQQAVDMDADVASLSQQGGLQLSQDSGGMRSPAPTSAAPQGRINFPAQRAGLLRSRLAREAIAKRAYMPPMADRAKPQQQPQHQQQQRRLAPGQSSLLDYGFSASRRSELTTASESMDMEM